MTSEDSLISEFLEIIMLQKYRDMFRGEGPLSVGSVGEFSRFLSDPNSLKEVGMTVFEINRFKRLCTETIQGLLPKDIKTECTFRLTIEVKESIQDNSTISEPVTQKEIGTIDKLKLRIKALTQEQIVKESTISLTVDLSIRYYELISEIHRLLRREIREIKFESVELYSDTGYPLAVSPYKYLQRISEWNLEQNAILYVYPKKMVVKEIPSEQLYKNNYPIKIAIESTDIVLSVLLSHVKLFCCELKTILSLQLHIPTEVIELHILFVDTQIKENPSDRLELELSLLVKEKVLVSIHILEHWKEESYLSAFNTNLYKSCVPEHNITDWNCFNCMLLYLSKEQQREEREHLLARLGLLRRISCSPPLVYALYRLMTGCTLCLPHRVAINEGILTTLPFLLLDREPRIHHFPALWMYLEKNARQEHRNTEIYETHYISKHTRERPRDQETKKLLQSFPPTEDTIVTWSDCPSAHEPFVYLKLLETDFPPEQINQRFPLKHPIELYKQYLESGIDYGILPPLTRDMSSYYVFLGPTKGMYGYFDFFDPHEGKSTSYHPHDIITPYPLEIEYQLSYRRLIIILDISRDMDLGCKEYTAGRDHNEWNLTVTSLDMAIRTIKLFIDSLVGTGCVYLLGVILISNNRYHHEVTNGICVLQTPTLEYVKALLMLQKLVNTYPSGQPLHATSFTRTSHGIIANALYYTIDNFASKDKDHKLQVFLLTNHMSDRKYCDLNNDSLEQQLTDYRVSLNTLILSDGTSRVLSRLSRITKGKYLDQRDIARQRQSGLKMEKIPSHFLLEYYTLFEDTLDPLGLCSNFKSYDRIYSAFKKILTNSDSTLEMVQREKEKFTDSFISKNIPNLIQILRQISSYSKGPNPYCKLFSIKENIQHWLCIIQGPDSTPYQNSVLFLEIRFGIHYPQKPPMLRFLSSYFHPNIRLSGEVCHPILFEDYNPSVSLRQIMDSIHGMICSPVPSHAVRYKVMEIFLFHKDVYGHHVDSFQDDHKFKRSVPDCLQDLCIQNISIPIHPLHYLCPLTKELFNQPVITPEGNTYERHAFLQHLKYNKTDPISNTQLTEADLIPNNELLSAVNLYRKEYLVRVYWWEQ